jgi:hypothetical protein
LNAGNDLELRLVEPLFRQGGGGEDDGIYRIAQIMTQDAEEAVAILALMVFVIGDCSGNAGIHYLIKPGDFSRSSCELVRFAFAPKAEDAGAQGAIFRDDLSQVETRIDSNFYMGTGEIFE